MVAGMVEEWGQEGNLIHTKDIPFCSKEPIHSEKYFKETRNQIVLYLSNFPLYCKISSPKTLCINPSHEASVLNRCVKL